MAQTTISVRMDENLKKQAESIFAEMGLNMSTAFNVFARAVVQRREIPFTISAGEQSRVSVLPKDWYDSKEDAHWEEYQ